MSQIKENKEAAKGTQTEVVAKAKRRQSTADYKLRILHEAEACKGHSEIRALPNRPAPFVGRRKADLANVGADSSARKYSTRPPPEQGLTHRRGRRRRP